MTFAERVSFAFRCFFSLLLHGGIPEDIARRLVDVGMGTGSVPAPAKSEVAGFQSGVTETYDRAVQMLALLQRDGRLIDFLAEDVSQYPDAQLGAAVRSIHQSCRQALDRYVKLEPVLASEEDQPITVQEGMDPASIKLIGNVTGQLPARGLLRHRGWRVERIELPSLSQVSDRMVVAPAEVEIT